MHMYTCMLGRTVDLIHHDNNTMHLDNNNIHYAKRFLRPMCRLLLIKEVVSLMYLISVYDPFFDTHLKQCEYILVCLCAQQTQLPLLNSKGRGTG